MQQQRSVQAQMARRWKAARPLAELTRQNMEMWSRMQASMLSALNPSQGNRPPSASAWTRRTGR